MTDGFLKILPQLIFYIYNAIGSYYQLLFSLILFNIAILYIL